MSASGEELARLDATDQAALVRRGEATPAELTEAAIERIEQLDPDLNAVITPRFDTARAEAAGDLPDGPFRGVPLLLKDLGTPSAGDPYYEGMGFLRDRGWVSDHDAYLTARLRAAGVVFCGRTNTPEWGSVPTTEPDAFGPTRNPWDTGRSAGGSSGGSAVAVATGMVPAATASDGGGSIRIPASACGIVGLKPTRGRVSLGPDYGETWAGFTVLGVLSRTVRDTAALLDVGGGPMPGDPYAAPALPGPLRGEVGADPGTLRVGLLAHVPGGSAQVSPECAAAVHAAGSLLAGLGHRVDPSYPAALDELADLQRNFGRVTSTWAALTFAHWEQATAGRLTLDDIEPLNRALVERGQARAAVAYLQAVTWLHDWSRRMAAWWEDGFDLLLTPVMPNPPLPLGSMEPHPDDPLAGMRTAVEVVTFAAPFNATGQPAISLPLHWTAEGLPVGAQLVAAAGREDLLVRVAAQLEEAAPWAHRRPPVRA